jgi:hypothetical protein
MPVEGAEDALCSYQSHLQASIREQMENWCRGVPSSRVIMCLVSGHASARGAVDAIRRVAEEGKHNGGDGHPNSSAPQASSTVVVLLAVPWIEYHTEGRTVVQELWDMHHHHHDSPMMRDVLVLPVPFRVAEAPVGEVHRKTRGDMWIDGMNSFWIGVLANALEVAVFSTFAARADPMPRKERCASPPPPPALSFLVVHHCRESVATLQNGLSLSAAHDSNGISFGLEIRFEVVMGAPL